MKMYYINFFIYELVTFVIYCIVIKYYIKILSFFIEKSRIESYIYKKINKKE